MCAAKWRPLSMPRKRDDSMGRRFVLLRAAGGVLSFEGIFLLFMFSGTFKADARFAASPVDLTVAFLVLSVAWFVGLYAAGKIQLGWRLFGYFLYWGILLSLGLLGLVWTPSRVYARDKLLLLATLGTWSLLAGALVVGPSRERIGRLIYCLAALSVWMAAEALAFYVRSGIRYSISLLGTTYLGVGRVIGYGCLATLWVILYRLKRLWAKLAAFAWFCSQLFVLAFLGGRGPLLAATAAILMAGFLSFTVRPDLRVRSTPRARVFLALFLGAVVVVVYLAQSGQQLHTITRLLEALSGAGGDSGGSASVRIRLGLYGASLDLWAQRPLLGHGIGAFPVLMGFGDRRSYPHNILLELLVEMGLVGMLVFLAMLTVVAYSLFAGGRLRRDAEGVGVAMLLVDTIVNAMLSGDLTDNRFLFFVFGVAAALVWGKRDAQRRVPDRGSTGAEVDSRRSERAWWGDAATTRASRARGTP